MNKQQALDNLKQLILDNKVCPELAAGATQLVMGDGNPDADMVFIGEAPGKKEDEHGLPFVGAAGKFLDEMLSSINLNRSDIYITNIVKYRPPDNRDPKEDEKQEFFPYLLQQLAIIEPKLLVTLGRHSLNMFLPEAKISQEHGRLKRKKFIYKDFTSQMQGHPVSDNKSNEVRSWVILPLYHPAAALYSGSMRSVLMEDFSNIPKVIEQIY